MEGGKDLKNALSLGAKCGLVASIISATVFLLLSYLIPTILYQLPGIEATFLEEIVELEFYDTQTLLLLAYYLSLPVLWGILYVFLRPSVPGKGLEKGLAFAIFLLILGVGISLLPAIVFEIILLRFEGLLSPSLFFFMLYIFVYLPVFGLVLEKTYISLTWRSQPEFRIRSSLGNLVKKVKKALGRSPLRVSSEGRGWTEGEIQNPNHIEGSLATGRGVVISILILFPFLLEAVAA